MNAAFVTGCCSDGAAPGNASSEKPEVRQAAISIQDAGSSKLALLIPWSGLESQ